MADVELLPCPECGMPCRAGEYHPFAACLMFKACHNSETVRANLAPLQAEIEALRAEVREAREFRDKMANAIGNDQLRRFIEKHGEPVPLTIRMQQAEARAERLAEALRELVEVFSESGMYDEEVFAKARAALSKEEGK